MIFSHTIPSSFVYKDEILEVRFLDAENHMNWYKGTVIHVDHYGYDEEGPYVECEIMYDDGEHAPDTRLYDKDFNDADNLNAWRFASNLSKLIESMENVHKELESVKYRLYDIEEAQEYDDDFESDSRGEDESDSESLEKRSSAFSWKSIIMFGFACVLSSHVMYKYCEYLDYKDKNDPMKPVFTM